MNALKWFTSKNMWNVKVHNILFLCCSGFPTLAFTAQLGLSASADGLCGKRAGWVSLVVRQHLKIARAEYLCNVMEPHLKSAESPLHPQCRPFLFQYLTPNIPYGAPKLLHTVLLKPGLNILSHPIIMSKNYEGVWVASNLQRTVKRSSLT